MHCQGLIRLQLQAPRRFAVALGMAALLISFNSIAQAIQYPIFCDNFVIGEVTVDPDDSGVFGGFASFEGAPASLGGAAQFCGGDHFNWFQVIIADNDAPNNVGGVKQVPPYIDPPLGGYGNPDVQWADGLAWLWDEGADPPPGTPGFEDGYNLVDVINDFNPGPGADDFLLFEDFPGGFPNSAVSFQTWLVTVNSDGSPHEFHEGFAWSWSNPGGGDGASVISPQTLTAELGLGRYQQLVAPALAADFNVDTKVDANDFAAWRAGFGKSIAAVRADGDSDGDHDVDGVDFLAWQRQFGLPSIAVAVPEPLTAVWLIPLFACVYARPRRATA